MRVTAASAPDDEPSFHDRVLGVLAALRAGTAVPLWQAARQLGVPVKRLFAPGVARVRVQSKWVTSAAEVARLRSLLAGGNQ